MSKKAIPLAVTFTLVVTALTIPHLLSAITSNSADAALKRGEFARQDGKKPPLGNTIIPQLTPVEITDSVIGTLRELNERAAQIFFRPGWLHISEERTYDTDLENNGVLDDGQVLPNEYTKEIWFHFNEANLVFESVSIMRSLDGQIVQVSVFSNTNSWNSALGKMGRKEPFALSSLDFNFLRDTRSYPWTTQVDEVLLESSGRLVLEFTSVRDYYKPVQSIDYEKPTTGVETRVQFDPLTGQLLMREVIAKFDDGSQRVFSIIRMEFSLGETPPAEVLKYLAGNG